MNLKTSNELLLLITLNDSSKHINNGFINPYKQFTPDYPQNSVARGLQMTDSTGKPHNGRE